MILSIPIISDTWLIQMLLFERICFPMHTALLRLAKSFLSKTEEWRNSCRSMNEVIPPSPACSPDTVLAGPGIYFSACCNKCSPEYFWKTDFLSSTRILLHLLVIIVTCQNIYVDYESLFSHWFVARSS